jgi:hypothetical protein
MSQPLELPDEVYSALQEAAAESGMTPADWIAARLPPKRREPLPQHAKTMADLFAGRIGGFHSGGREPLSEKSTEVFTDALEQKRRDGRL